MSYSFVKRANTETKKKMLELVISLNDSEDKAEHWSIEQHKNGYAVVLDYDDGIEKWQDRAALVRCNFCGELRELFDGQVEFCYHCNKDWK